MKFAAYSGLMALAASGAAAFPAATMRALAEARANAFEGLPREFVERQGVGLPPVTPFPDNFGLPRPPLSQQPFDDKQQTISLSGDHEWRAPGPNDQRGPCPGLNAAANHGYLPRDGIATRETVINGLHEMTGLSTDALIFLETTTSFFDGDPVSGKWSIGGRDTRTALLGPIQNALLGEQSGICGLGHLKSEGDASITRGDFLQPTGENSNCRSYPKFFKELIDLAQEMNGDNEYKGQITPRVLAEHQHRRKLHSIANNPYYYSPAFAGVAFTPAAHHFVVAMMATRNATQPEGVTSIPDLMDWFSYTGDPSSVDTLTYKYGYERIPSTYRRRNAANQWTLADIVAAVAQQAISYPSTTGVGGNTGTVNSFAGINVGDLTGGVYNAQALQDPEKMGCFISQTIQAEAPTALQGVLAGPQLAAALDTISTKLNPMLDQSFGQCTALFSEGRKPKGRTEREIAGDRFPALTMKADDSRAYSPKP